MTVSIGFRDVTLINSQQVFIQPQGNPVQNHLAPGILSLLQGDRRCRRRRTHGGRRESECL